MNKIFLTFSLGFMSLQASHHVIQLAQRGIRICNARECAEAHNVIAWTRDNLEKQWNLRMDWQSTGVADIQKKFLEAFFANYEQKNSSALSDANKEKIKTIVSQKLQYAFHIKLDHKSFIAKALIKLKLSQLQWLYVQIDSNPGPTVRKAIVSMKYPQPELKGTTLYFSLSEDELAVLHYITEETLKAINHQELLNQQEKVSS